MTLMLAESALIVSYITYERNLLELTIDLLFVF